MRVTVNGETRDISATSVAALLAELDYEGTHFAIALNYDVVPKSRWAETALKAGDEIHFLSEDDHPPLLALLWRVAAPLVPLGVLTVPFTAPP